MGAGLKRVRLAGLLPEPMGPYTDAVRAGGLLPLDAQGNLAGEGDAAAQADQVFRNLQAVLA